MQTSLDVTWCPDGTVFLSYFAPVPKRDLCWQIDTGNKILDHFDKGKEVTFSELICTLEETVKPWEPVGSRAPTVSDRVAKLERRAVAMEALCAEILVCLRANLSRGLLVASDGGTMSVLMESWRRRLECGR